MKPLNARPLLDDWGWQVQAACRGMAVSVFFSPHYERGDSRQRREQRAKAICRECPVRQRCAAFALRTGQAFGVWGGLTEADRGYTRRPA
ncbi:WhiB family redox-sensing transcriptional regulator [Catenulispora sp. MAP12-49]|jgi:WhiB family redox-sensing transcriptional regulator|uniref:WhiB family transcriptional regulator n=1 Tax=unclassified Catenulispora TaxID=414885 RepID=UPI0035173A8D